MDNKTLKTSLKIAGGSALALTLAASPIAAQADTNPFGMTAMVSGYAVGQTLLAEAKCGGNKAPKAAEAKCGADKAAAAAKAAEAKCGADKKAVKSKPIVEAKCGEAKCGADKK